MTSQPRPRQQCVRPPWRSGGVERGQASVELALVLPVVVVLLLAVLQAGVLVRDRLATVHAARVAARAVIVDPTPTAAAAALEAAGGRAGDATAQVGGERRAGGYATVTVRLTPARLPIVGRVVGATVLTETLTVLVEGRS